MRFCVFITLLTTSTNLYSQYSERIVSPRPGQSFGPNTVGKSIFQVQTGVKFFDGKNDDSNLDFKTNGYSYLASFRYGISELIELRSAVMIRQDNNELNSVETTLSGVSLWNLGIRINLQNGQDYQPSLGFQADVRLNAVSEDYNPNQIAPRLILLLAQKISNKIKLISNMGVNWNGNNEIPRGFYTIKLNYPVSSTIGFMIENYGNLQSNDFDTFLDTGFAFWLNNNLQLDIAGSFGRNDNFREVFVDTGVSWRFGR